MYAQSVPKQKPLATKKKKLPMSILGLLGLALVLVGIVAAIGLTQINQDGRSNASRGTKACYDSSLGEGIEGARRQQECFDRNNYWNSESQEDNYERLKNGERQNLSPEQQAIYDKQSVAAARARNASSRGSNSTASIAPTNMRVECSSDNKNATIRWDNKGKANSFSIGVDKINSCGSPADGWMCAPGDFVKTMSCTASTCSYKFKVEKGRYGTVAITAVKGGERMESKLTKGFSCR